MRSPLRERLAEVVAKKVDAHGTVVWEDPEREYADIAESLCPESATFARLGGSWYALRAELEQLVNSPIPPRLVVYQPAETPDEDPLAEVRLAGTVLRHRLATLVRDALAGELTQDRIAELARGSRSLREVEAALSGDGGAGVRLPAALGTSDAQELALRVLADDDAQKAVDTGGLWGEVEALFQRFFGISGPIADVGALADAFRQLLLAELASAGGTPPPGLEGVSAPTTDHRRARGAQLLGRWRRDRLRLGAYRKRALDAEAALDLGRSLEWREGFERLDSVKSLEDLALREVARLLAAGELEQAAELAGLRERLSMWTAGEVVEAEHWVPTWRAASATAQLLLALAGTTGLGATGAQALRWYASEGWRIDAAHRRMEEALSRVPAYGVLEDAVREARVKFERWLDRVAESVPETLAQGLESAELPRQALVHERYLRGQDEPVAYVLVDALRYELGEDLAHALGEAGGAVEISAAVATPPTLTPVGMASLLPGAESGLSLRLDERGRLGVEVDGAPAMGVSARVERLRAAHGEVLDLPLTEVFDQGEQELRERIGGASVVLVRSQEIDAALESDRTAAAWSYVRDIGGLIARAVARLRHAGIGRAVIAADHGFLVLSRAVGADRSVEPPGGEGELHRRCWIGRGGTAADSAVRTPLGDLGVGGDLDLVVPKGLGVFPAGGARRFLHGGLSPQELVVPVLAVRFPPVAEQPGDLIAEVAGGQIVTGVFSGRLELRGNLFSDTAILRVVGRRKRDGERVAELAAGTGFDADAGTVALTAEDAAIVTLRVTKSLRKGDRVVLELYDAQTDRRLGVSKEAQVLADVPIEDELD